MPKIFKEHLLTPPHLLPKPQPELEAHSSVHYSNSPSFAQPPLDYDEDLIKDLFIWKAPSRPYRKKDRSYLTTAFILVVLVSLVSFLLDSGLLAAALAALLFVVIILNYVPPEEIEYKISTQGITIGNHFYHWYDLDSFWFGKKEDKNILYIATLYRFPGIIMVILNDEINQEEIKKACAHFLPYQEIAPKTFFDNLAEKIQKHFPLETPRA